MLLKIEADALYRICDELGILVWQDFMFTSMHYPFDDEQFLSNVTAEVKYQVARLSAHSCVAVYCGNTDVQQQAAMVGTLKEAWSHSFFNHLIPDICQSTHKGIPYFAPTFRYRSCWH